jgi:hypothetical protein
VLRRGLDDSDPEFRIEVLEILSDRGDIESLRKALADRNDEVRESAADLLWNVTTRNNDSEHRRQSRNFNRLVLGAQAGKDCGSNFELTCRDALTCDFFSLHALLQRVQTRRDRLVNAFGNANRLRLFQTVAGEITHHKILRAG